MIKEIEKMINERHLLLDNDPENDQIDILTNQIWFVLKENQDKLSVEFIIESLTKLGGAPSILYDDNGHFTIGGDGSQNLPTFEDNFETKETVFNAYWLIKPGHWKKTIREAIKCYFEDNE